MGLAFYAAVVNAKSKKTPSLPMQTAALAVLLFSSFILSANAQLGLPPKITVQPTNTTVLNGGTASFTVEAYSLLSMTYKWYCNGVQIPGATKSTYTDTNAIYAHAGDYHVEVSNLVGKDQSQTATLTVVDPTVRFQSAEMCTNGFRMTLSGPASAYIVLSVSSDNSRWTPTTTNYCVSGNLVLTDTSAKNRSARFYRAQALQSAPVISTNSEITAAEAR